MRHLAANSYEWVPELFEKQGYQTLASGWPGDEETVAATRAGAERMAGVGVDAVADSYTRIIESLGKSRSSSATRSAG